MNFNLYGHNGRWLLVDCGITFEHPEVGAMARPSIEMADPSFIIAQRDKIDGLVITHAHEDHLGAVPYVWSHLGVPVYTTPFTAAVLQDKVRARKARSPEPLIVVSPGEQRQIGVFSVRWMPITHSTPETCALLIDVPGCRIFHTADWKLDTAPVVGDPWRSGPFDALGDGSVDAMICDSTNALKPGASPTERAVTEGLLAAVSGRTGRVVVACFASNIARLQSVLRVGAATGRRTGLLGRSLETMARIARQQGLLDPAFLPIEAAHLGYLPEAEVLALATGSQGEVGAALHRLAMNTHRHLTLSEGDTVIFSATTIPGNERAVARLVSGFQDRGIHVLHADSHELCLHASGHPCRDELLDLYRRVRPRVAIPVHGEREHMQANAKIAREAGVPIALTGENGDLFWLSPSPAVRRRAVTPGRWAWDERDQRLTSV